ncbi:hypothetical protein BGX28_008530 [Mortierella sp. GBA30]|nr:hypothetical protein BGX28_008530 [Mortierella sp. GBA30]
MAQTASPSYKACKYKIKLEDQIGHGAHAHVFKAKCGLDDVVVKKFLNLTHKDTLREVEITRQLCHSNIVQFFLVQQDMILMEYIEGGTLADAITERGGRRDSERAGFDWDMKIHISKDILLGLAYLHGLGIIHGDIKSANILLTKYNKAKIYHFDQARTRTETVGEKVGAVGRGGSLQWMAPELLQDPPQYSSKSDVYAFGMVLWEMASECVQPYREHTPDGIIQCIMNSIHEEIPVTTPKDYVDWIQECWRTWPQDRPDLLSLSGHPLRGQDDDNEPIGTGYNGEKLHYFKTLKKYVKDSTSMVMLKLSDLLDDKTHTGVAGADNRGGGFIITTKDTRSFYSYDRKGNEGWAWQGRDNLSKTMEWFSNTATASGYESAAAAMFRLGVMYYSGRHVKKDYKVAAQFYVAASTAGVAVAMLNISRMYRCGHGPDQDDSGAAEWHRRAEDAVEKNEQQQHHHEGKRNNRKVRHEAGVSEHHRTTTEWFSSANGEGSSASAKLIIGDMYYHGGDVEQDYNSALKWYLKASKMGEADGMFRIGKMYYLGHGVELDYRKALEWYHKASVAGHATATTAIAKLYYYGHGVNQSYGKALEWFLKANDAGDPIATYRIASMYCNGWGLGHDPSKTLEWYRKASDIGNCRAMSGIASFYFSGCGVKQDYGKALEWYLKASDAGDAFAMSAIANMYLDGRGVERQYSKALEWYLKASDAGEGSAMYNIGKMYYWGYAVDRDYGKAMEWYLKASEAGSGSATFYLGTMYNDGVGVDQSYSKALEWFLKASDAGEGRAMVCIGKMYHSGLGVLPDYGKALKWYLKANRAEVAVAMLSIGDMYHDGQGVLADRSQAIQWYFKAREAGVAEASKRLKKMDESGHHKGS